MFGEVRSSVLMFGEHYEYTLQIVCIFFVCEEANKTLNYLRLIANKANKIQRPIKIKIKASIKVPPALKRHFC